MNLGNETEIIEFKNTIDELEEGIISLSSMLNKHKHGTLYFGVKDNGDVVAQEIGKSTLRDISQAIANAIKPQCIPTISVEFFDPVTVIRVSISGNERPYSAYGKYYIRSADEDRELSPTQLKELMLQSTENTIVNIESRNQDLKFSQIKCYT